MSFRLVLLAASGLALSTGCGVVAGNLAGGLWMGQSPTATGGASRNLGTSVVCLGTTANLGQLQSSATVFQVQGHLLNEDFNADRGDFDNVVPCWTEPSTTLQIEDDNGDIWTVGFGWLESSGYDVTPWPSARTDEELNLLIRADRSAGSEAAGMALSRNGRLIYALESGRNGQGLQSGDISGVDLRTTEGVGSFNSECGERLALAQQFTSDSNELVMYAGEDQGFEVDGEYMTTCSIDAWELVEGDCGDGLVSESSWVMFR